jgi:SSS family solute:Na+ symporter
MAQLQWIDYSIMAVYVVFVLGIGWVLKRKMKTSTDFFLSGRSIPAWICGLAFISANLGALEVIGMGAMGAEYGIATSHFYWIGAIPAMIFVGLFMMPYYYGSRARSVPEYLKLRFDEKTRGLNAISFAVMTVMASGMSMHAMGEISAVLFGEEVFGMETYTLAVVISAVIVLFYIFAGGLTSAIYNEVLQFFLIVFGLIPLVYLGLKNVGWWSGLKEKLAEVAVANKLPEHAYTESWAYMGDPARNPMGVEWFGLAMGLGFVLSFGYWCTDFLVVQRAMAADSMAAARRTPLIAAVPKMLFPALVIIPGMVALVVPAAAPRADGAKTVAAADAPQTAQQTIIPPKEDSAGNPKIENGKVVLNYDRATPMMLVHYLPAGVLGLGLTALLASFMSGMAGNVTALNTVWTYDIYQSYIHRTASDSHYLWMGRYATVVGILLSIAAAYVAKEYNNIMNLLQLVFAFVNAPLFATFAIGMFWRRATGHGAFFGLLSGTLAAAVHHGLTFPRGAEPGGLKGGYILKLFLSDERIAEAGNLFMYRSSMAQNFWTAIYAFGVCFVVSIVISLFTKPRPDEELKGLVYSLTPRPDEGHLPWHKRPAALAIVVLALTIALNIIFY